MPPQPRVPGELGESDLPHVADAVGDPKARPHVHQEPPVQIVQILECPGLAQHDGVQRLHPWWGGQVVGACSWSWRPVEVEGQDNLPGRRTVEVATPFGEDVLTAQPVHGPAQGGEASTTAGQLVESVLPPGHAAGWAGTAAAKPR